MHLNFELTEDECNLTGVTFFFKKKKERKIHSHWVGLSLVLTRVKFIRRAIDRFERQPTNFSATFKSQLHSRLDSVFHLLRTLTTESRKVQSLCAGTYQTNWTYSSNYFSYHVVTCMLQPKCLKQNMFLIKADCNKARPVWLLAINSAWNTNDRILWCLFLLLHLDSIAFVFFGGLFGCPHTWWLGLALKSQLTGNVWELFGQR